MRSFVFSGNLRFFTRALLQGLSVLATVGAAVFVIGGIYNGSIKYWSAEIWAAIQTVVVFMALLVACWQLSSFNRSEKVKLTVEQIHNTDLAFVEMARLQTDLPHFTGETVNAIEKGLPWNDPQKLRAMEASALLPFNAFNQADLLAHNDLIDMDMYLDRMGAVLLEYYADTFPFLRAMLIRRDLDYSDFRKLAKRAQSHCKTLNAHLRKLKITLTVDAFAMPANYYTLMNVRSRVCDGLQLRILVTMLSNMLGAPVLIRLAV